MEKIRIFRNEIFGKILHVILFAIVLVMIIISLWGLIIIHFSLAEYSFDFTPEGFDFYLMTVSRYKGLFLATITVIVAFCGLQSWKTASVNQKDRLRQDRFSEWKAALEYRFEYSDQNDPVIRKIFTTERWRIFNVLYQYDLKIENKNQLRYIFQMFFEKSMSSMESKNIQYKVHHEVYPDKEYVYSYDSLRWILLGCLPGENYPGMDEDLKKYMIDCLPPGRIINRDHWDDIEMIEGVKAGN